jgi:hypothetical protein
VLTLHVWGPVLSLVISSHVQSTIDTIYSTLPQRDALGQRALAYGAVILTTPVDDQDLDSEAIYGIRTFHHSSCLRVFPGWLVPPFFSLSKAGHPELRQFGYIK